MFNQFVTDIAFAVAKGIELIGVVIIASGALVNLAVFLPRFFGGDREAAVASLRSNFGRSILLGLEFLIAADIIETVAVTTTLQSVVVLAVIVAVRTFLSFSLQLEIDGRWPWQRHIDDKKRKV